MVKNLSQLKRSLQSGSRFRVIDHGRPACVGEERQVTYANTQGFYSIVPSDVCTLYVSDTKRTKDHMVMSLEVIEKEAA